MNFADLYRYVNTELNGRNVSVRAITKRIEGYHPHVGRIETWACDLDTDVSLGHIEYETDRTGPYSEPFDVAVISYERSMNCCWRRLVCAKEIMHIFDSSSARANSEEKFRILLNELETAPLSSDASPMYQSERNALWMALLVLCPERLRAPCLNGDDGEENIMNIAQQLKIPVGGIRALRGKYYAAALEKLTGEVA